MRTIHASFEKQRAKYLQWARLIHEIFGSEPFARIKCAVELGISVKWCQAITADMRELEMLQSSGNNRAMRWQLTRKICEEITG